MVVMWFAPLSLLSYKLPLVQGVTFDESHKNGVIIESIGAWDEALQYKNSVIARSKKTDRITRVDLSTGQSSWLIDVSDFAGDSHLHEYGLARLDDVEVLKVIVGHDTTLLSRMYDLETGRLIDANGDDFEYAAKDSGDLVTYYKTGFVQGPSWIRDEAFANITAILPILSPSLSHEEHRDEVTDLNDPLRLEPFYEQPMVIYTNVVPASPVIVPAKERCESKRMLAIGDGRVSVICVSEDIASLIIESTYVLPGSLCPTGAMIDRKNSLHRIARDAYMYEYHCHENTTLVHTAQLAFNKNGRLAVSRNLDYDSTDSSIESTAQGLYLVNRGTIAEGNVSSCKRVVAFSPFVRHLLRSEAHQGPDSLVVMTDNDSDGLKLLGYKCQFETGEEASRVDQIYETKLSNAKLVRRIGHDETRMALSMAAMNGAFAYSPTVTKQDGNTLQKYPARLLSMYLTEELSTGRMAVTMINSITGELTASYQLPEVAENNNMIRVLRSDNQLYVMYRGLVPKLINPNDIGKDRLNYIDSIELFTELSYHPWQLMKESIGLASTPESLSVQDIPGPLLVAKTYIVPYPIDDWVVTQTELGITPRHLIVKLFGRGIWSVPLNSVSARRPLLQANEVPLEGEMEESLMPFDPLPFKTTSGSLDMSSPFHRNSHLYSFGGAVDNMISFPVPGIESGTQFVMTKKGIFGFALLHPAGTFDSLPSDHDLTHVKITIMALIVAITASLMFKRFTSSRSKWE